MTTSFSFLNFLANICIILPYFIILDAYNFSHNPLLLVTLIVIYASRSMSIIILNTTFTRLNNILVGTVTGLIGALMLAILQLNAPIAIIAGILLGYHSSTLWPLFLAGETDLEGRYTVNKRYMWLIFIILAVILMAALTIFVPKYSYQLNFAIYIAVCLIALPAAIKMTQAVLIQEQRAPQVKLPTRSHWLLILIFIIFTSRLVLFFLSKSNSTNYLPDFIFTILLILLSLQLIMINRKYDNKRIFNLTVLRGILMTYILFFAPFYTFAWFGTRASLITYALYLLGFELGATLVKKFSIKPTYLLYAGLLLIAIPFNIVYPFGILALTLYLGNLNIFLNQHHIQGDTFSMGGGIIRKYHLSSFGSQISYASIFLVLIIFAAFNQINLYAFFSNKYSTLTLHVYLINLTLILVMLAIVTIGAKRIKKIQ